MKAEFYDKKYTKNPRHWALKERDITTYNYVRNYSFSRVIDIGCGVGHTLGHFQRERPEATYYGIDWSPVAISVAQANYTEIKFEVKEILELDARKKFDLVLNLGTLEHLEDLEAGLAKFKRLIATGGVGYFEAPNNLAYSPGEETYRQLKSGSRQWEWHLSAASWEERFKDAGLEIVARHKGSRPPFEFIWVLQ